MSNPANVPSDLPGIPLPPASSGTPVTGATPVPVPASSPPVIVTSPTPPVVARAVTVEAPLAKITETNPPNSWLQDEAISAIHDSIQLGWSLVELKSRVQIAAFRATSGELKPGVSDEQEGIFNQLMNSLLREDDVTAKGGELSGTAGELENRAAREDKLAASNKLAASLLESLTGGLNFFLKGPEKGKTVVQTGDSTWLVSTWRSVFRRILSLQYRLFPDLTFSAEAVGVVDNRSGVFPYLYLDFSEYGIASADLDHPEILQKVEICELTRRVLNSLTLLHTDPEESLLPSVVRERQRQLIAKLVEIQPDPISGEKPPLDWSSAVAYLSALAVRLIDFWDGLLREHLYPGGVFHNDLTELTSYEAGRSIGSLSWSISVTTFSLRQNRSTQDPAYLMDLFSTWTTTFNKREIIHIQHQLSAISSVLDDGYYRVKNIPRPKDPSTGAIDPELPSELLKAVKSSLDYWMRTLDWIAKKGTQEKLQDKLGPARSAVNKPVMTVEMSEKLRIALIQQADVWQSLLLYQQTLRSFTLDSVTQRILSDFMDEFEQFAGQELAKASTNGVSLTLGTMIQHFNPIFLIGGGIIVTFIFLLAAFIWLNPSFQEGIKAGFGSIFSAGGIGGVVGLWALNRFSKSNFAQTKTIATVTQPGSVATTTTTPGGSTTTVATTNLLDQVSQIFGNAGQAVTDAFQKGYEQIQIEFGQLNFQVAVAYPLVEFFVANGSALDIFGIKTGYDFLTQVVWDEQEREDDIRRIARASFGPIGGLVGAQLNFDPLKVQPAK